jgi:hypothetical protein
MALLDRYWSKVMVAEGGCWFWIGAITSDGYGHIREAGRNSPTLYVHRLAYELEYGRIAEGMQIDHLCRMRFCVNPKHLEEVTQQENIRRGKAGNNFSKRTHCNYGHPFSGYNLIIRSNGARRCRTCNAGPRITRKEYNERRPKRQADSGSRDL